MYPNSNVFEFLQVRCSDVESYVVFGCARGQTPCLLKSSGVVVGCVASLGVDIGWNGLQMFRFYSFNLNVTSCQGRINTANKHEFVWNSACFDWKNVEQLLQHVLFVVESVSKIKVKVSLNMSPVCCVRSGYGHSRPNQTNTLAIQNCMGNKGLGWNFVCLFYQRRPNINFIGLHNVRHYV